MVDAARRTTPGVDLDRLYRAHADELRRFVVRLTGDRALADDLVHDALLRAWRADVRLEPEALARAWLFRTVRNLVIDDRRSAWRRRELAVDELPETPQDGMEEQVVAAVLAREALLELSLEHRTVVVLAYHRRLTVPEIAVQLGIPPGTVKSRMHHAMRALRASLAARGEIR